MTDPIDGADDVKAKAAVDEMLTDMNLNVSKVDYRPDIKTPEGSVAVEFTDEQLTVLNQLVAVMTNNKTILVESGANLSFSLVGNLVGRLLSCVEETHHPGLLTTMMLTANYVSRDFKKQKRS